MPMPTLGVMTAKGEGPRDEAGGAAGFGWRRALLPSLSIALPGGVQNSGEDREAKLPLLDFDLEPPPEVNHFLQEPACSLGEDDGSRSSPEHLVEEYKRWVT